MEGCRCLTLDLGWCFVVWRAGSTEHVDGSREVWWLLSAIAAESQHGVRSVWVSDSMSGGMGGRTSWCGKRLCVGCKGRKKGCDQL